MNDKKRSTPAGRIAQLAQMDEIVFHTRDLANIWGIVNKNTLYTTLKRYARQGLLFRVQKGMYALRPVAQIDPLLLGIKALHRYAYVSTETILVREGIMMQVLPVITLVSDVSKRFSVGTHRYHVRGITTRFLYNDAGISRRDGLLTASPERAVADLLYVNSHAFLDRADAVDWDVVQRIQKKVGYL